MSSWTQICDELSECERQIVAIRLKTEERLEKENDRFAMVEKKRDECIEEHKRNLADAVEECEQQLANVSDKTEQQLNASIEARKQAELRERTALQKAEAAEQQARELEVEMRQLRSILDKTLEEEDQLSQELIRSSDAEVQRNFQETDRTVQDTARFASELQEGVVDAIEVLHKEHQGHIRETELGSSQRSRYVEMYSAAVNHSTQKVSDEDFLHHKGELVQGWYDDWVKTTSSVGGPSPLVNRLQLDHPPEKPMSPLEATRPRSVERARQRVMDRLGAV
mmetsp:Transcript_28005/g.63395  ORF Transcript_28005/g.63395 Transcript_28005/m.63395 type:complete len:281 (-) Transcript_28005:74-916(-)